jgi:hypothetical protein
MVCQLKYMFENSILRYDSASWDLSILRQCSVLIYRGWNDFFDIPTFKMLGSGYLLM